MIGQFVGKVRSFFSRFVGYVVMTPKDPIIVIKRQINFGNKFLTFLKQWKLIFNLLKQRKIVFKISVNRNRKKLTVSRKKVNILTVNRKRHKTIETLFIEPIS